MKPLLGAAATQSTIHTWLLLLRIFVSGFMLTHGIPKLMKIIAGNLTFGDPLGIGSGPSLILATLAEVGFALLVLVGFQTRLAILPILFTMLVAAFLANADKPFKDRELPLMYLLTYGTLFFTGPGKYSIDAKQSKTWPR